jgi:hypothetical protein
VSRPVPKPGSSLRLTLVAIHPGRSPQSVPLAAAFLAAAVTAAFAEAVTVTILDLYTDQSAEECARLVRETQPDLAGFSVYLWNRSLCCAVAGILKRETPPLTLFCGGPEATADQQQLLAEAPWDFLIHGDGETPLVAAVRLLLGGREPAAAAGVATLPAGLLQSNPATPLKELDELPSPLLSGVLEPSRYAGMLWQISRGCSFNCDFCFDAGGSRQVRRFSVQRLEEELRWLVQQRVSQVFVLDSTFNSDKARAVAILRLIRKIAPAIHFHFEVRSEFLDREQANLFASITCSLQIGLQSGSSGVLQSVGRRFNRADFVSKVNLLNEAGAIFGFDLIYGLPGDSLAGFRASLDFALGLMPNHLDIFPLALLPGTKLAARAAELQLVHLPAPPYTLLASPAFPAAELAIAGRLAEACDIFYSRGKAVSWFLTLLAPLQLPPSELLLRFAAYLGDKRGAADALDDSAIFALQTGFIATLYAAPGAKRLLPLALDLVTYNHHYAAALMAVPPQPLSKKGLARLRMAELQPQLAPSARLADFSYDILKLLEVESGDLKQMAKLLSPAASLAVIYPHGGEIRTETLHPAYGRLLERLDGRRSVAAVATELGMPLADAVEFVTFALGEGIVVLPGNNQ